MFCPNCGKELKDTSKFCTGCGAAIKRPPVVAQEPIPVETPTPAEPEPVAVTPQLPVVEPAKTIVEPVKQVVDQEKTDNEPKPSGFVHPEIIDVNVGNTNEENYIEPEPKYETEPKLEEKFVVEQEHIEIAEDDEDSWFEEKKKAKKQIFVDVSGTSESKKEVGEKAKKSDDKKNVEKKPTNLQTSKKGAVGIVISVIAILLVAGIIIAAVLISDNVFVEEEFNPGDCIDSCDTYDESFNELMMSCIRGEDVLLPYTQEIIEYSYNYDEAFLQSCFIPNEDDFYEHFNIRLEDLWFAYKGTGSFYSEEDERIRNCIESVYAEHSENIEIYDVLVSAVVVDDTEEDYDGDLGYYADKSSVLRMVGLLLEARKCS